MTDIRGSVVDDFERLLEPGCLVAINDGAGMVSSELLGELSEAARRTGHVSLLLGWCLAEREGLDLGAFADVRTVMGGYALRDAVREGRVEYLPVRLGTMPRLLSGPLRPRIFVTALAPHEGALAFGTEVGWARAALKWANATLVEENEALPVASAVDAIARDAVRVISHMAKNPDEIPRGAMNEPIRQIGRTVASLITTESAIQFGPGAIAEAMVSALEVAVVIDSGVIVDAVMDLDRRGLLRSEPMAAYVAGSRELYAWAKGRSILRGVEDTHDISRLAARPLFAINTALEVDLSGQVNVESAGGRSIAGIGGHADYALAASRSGGLSIVAMPTTRGGQRTLVERLSGPTSTARSDIDVVVTERGLADLRGKSDRARAAALESIW